MPSRRPGSPPSAWRSRSPNPVFFENNAANLDALRQLHALGVKIALDDFGTGYSALSYLLSYPFDKIKIDGSFVRALDNTGGAQAIVHAVAEIGDRLGMITTAEGVETAEQLRNVYAAGYTEAQGYLIARPMPAAQVLRMLVPEDDRDARFARWSCAPSDSKEAEPWGSATFRFAVLSGCRLSRSSC